MPQKRRFRWPEKWQRPVRHDAVRLEPRHPRAGLDHPPRGAEDAPRVLSDARGHARPSERPSPRGRDHHDLVANSSQTPLDHHTSLETTLLKGRTAAVRAFTDAVRAERGVRYAQVNLISVSPNAEAGHGHPGHSHQSSPHLSPFPG